MSLHEITDLRVIPIVCLTEHMTPTDSTGSDGASI